MKPIKDEDVAGPSPVLPPIAQHLGRALEYEIEQKRLSEGLCPKCETELIPQSGCLYCPNPACGWSACEN